MSSVKKVPRKTAPKTGLENRGTKPTIEQQINRARELQWNKAEKNYEASQNLRAAGPRGGADAKLKGPKEKNLRKQEAIKKEANKKAPIKIDSNPVKPGKTRIGSLSGIRGGGGGAINWQIK